jgi:hypothetical protein
MDPDCEQQVLPLPGTGGDGALSCARDPELGCSSQAESEVGPPPAPDGSPMSISSAENRTLGIASSAVSSCNAKERGFGPPEDSNRPLTRKEWLNLLFSFLAWACTICNVNLGRYTRVAPLALASSRSFCLAIVYTMIDSDRAYLALPTTTLAFANASKSTTLQWSGAATLSP